jgi:hypothetical protein
VKRAVLIATGVVLVLLGVLLVGAGGAAAALFGSDGSLSTVPARVSGDGVALVVEDISIDASSIPVPEGLGTLTLSVSDAQGGTMFVGSASGEAVDTYLTGAPYDVVVAVSAGSAATTRPVPGTQQPPPPATQPFWNRQATGSPAELTARVSSATTLVVMNADATPGVDAELVVTLTVARAWSAAWIAVGVGVLLVLLGVVAFWRARVARRRAREAALAAAPPVVGTAVSAPGATILPGAAPLEPPVAATAAVVAAAEASVLERTQPVETVPPADEAAGVTDAGGDPTTGPVAGRDDAGAPTEQLPPVPAPVPDQADSADDTAAGSAAEPETEPEAEQPVEAAVEEPADSPVFDAALAAAPAAYAVTGEDAPGAEHAGDDGAGDDGAGDEPEQAAGPVDMAALFAPLPGDDATAVLPVVTSEQGAPGADPGADPPGPVAPAETQHPAG